MVTRKRNSVITALELRPRTPGREGEAADCVQSLGQWLNQSRLHNLVLGRRKSTPLIVAKRPLEPLHQDPSQSHYSGYTGLFDSSPACQTRLTLGPFYLSFALYLEGSSPRSLHGFILHTICVQDIITCHFWGKLPRPWYLTKSAFLSPISHSLSSYPVLFHLFVCLLFTPFPSPKSDYMRIKNFCELTSELLTFEFPKLSQIRHTVKTQ